MSIDISRYSKKSKLGAGTYGTVYLAIDKITGQEVAMKIMKFDQEEDGIPATYLREMSILNSVSHTNIVKLIGVSFQANQLVLVTEYLDFSLRYLLLGSKVPMDPSLIRSYAFQMFSAIFTLHTHRVIHRDLKPENILLNKDGTLKICDFGLSRYFSLPLRQYSPDVVSQWYRAPELLFGNRFYDISIDMWSAGCILAEMVLRQPLFNGDSDTDQMHKIFAILGSPTSETLPNYNQLQQEFVIPEYTKKDLGQLLNTDDPYLIDLISKLLVYDPLKRISANEALHHPYFQQLNPKIIELCWPDGFPL